MNENFIKVMWQQDENGNPPTRKMYCPGKFLWMTF